MQMFYKCIAFFILVFFLPFAVIGAVDYNKEFSDNYFKLDKRDADINIKVFRKSPGTKVDPIGKQDGTSGKKTVKQPQTEEDDEISISALGKILQLSLVLLLGLLIYTLSRKNRKKKRY